MVKIRVWKMVAVGLVLAWLCEAAGAAEPTPPAKSECKVEVEARAKAAFAFAKLKEEAKAKTAPAAAPMPKSKEPKAGAALCPCGDKCQCPAGTCPSCPSVGTAGPVGRLDSPAGASIVKGITAAKPPPAAPVAQWREVWYTDGRRAWKQLEPVGPADRSGSGDCSIGRCPLQR
jgi:hypothetical protein